MGHYNEPIGDFRDPARNIVSLNLFLLKSGTAGVTSFETAQRHEAHEALHLAGRS